MRWSATEEPISDTDVAARSVKWMPMVDSEEEEDCSTLVEGYFLLLKIRLQTHQAYFNQIYLEESSLIHSEELNQAYSEEIYLKYLH